MNKNIIDLENPNDIEEIHRLLYDDDDFGEEDFNGSDDSETEDCVEMRDLMSDTDHEVENSENEGNLELDNTHFFYGEQLHARKEAILLDLFLFSGKNGTQWRKQPWKKTHSRPQNIMRVLRGVIQAARKSKTEIECWKLFFSDDILDLIVANTNNYIQIVKDKLHRERDSRPTDITEMKACFGLLYLAGVFRGGRQNLHDMWATDDLGINMFRMAMSEKRFRFLIRCIQLSLGQNVAVDVQLPAFRGSCGFRQYIPSKPTKYGLKIFCPSDAKLFYTSNMELYCGQQPEGPYRQNNSAEAVVLRLAEPIYGSGRNITADNWFTRLSLVQELEKKKLSYVGTIRKNRREIPSNFVTAKGREQYDSVFWFFKK